MVPITTTRTTGQTWQGCHWRWGVPSTCLVVALQVTCWDKDEDKRNNWHSSIGTLRYNTRLWAVSKHYVWSLLTCQDEIIRCKACNPFWREFPFWEFLCFIITWTWLGRDQCRRGRRGWQPRIQGKTETENEIWGKWKVMTSSSLTCELFNLPSPLWRLCCDIFRKCHCKVRATRFIVSLK